LGTYQKVIVATRLTRDPELKYLADGTPVASLSGAVDCGWGDKKHTMWIRASAWRKTAEFCAQYLGKGDLVLIEGTLTPDKETGNPRTYTSQSGEARASYEINADRVQALHSKPRDEGAQDDVYADESEIPF